MRLYEFICEAPIQDYQTLGNFDKNSSFKERDRKLITNPATIERVKQKFASTDHNFNLFFVNSPKANKYTEIGKVSEKWVHDNLGEDVFNAVVNATNFDDSVNVIFTNNKGAQGKNMTAWIMAHRIAHALGRSQSGYSGGRRIQKQFTNYEGSANALHSYAADIMELYGRRNIPNTYDKMIGSSFDDRGNNRRNQLSYLHFMTSLCTFRSARENVIRDWFEVLHELFAQYITTGKVQFNPPPNKFGTNQTGNYYLKPENKEDAQELIDQMASGLEYMFDDLISEAVGTVLVM